MELHRQITSPLLGRRCSSLEPEGHTTALPQENAFTFLRPESKGGKQGLRDSQEVLCETSMGGQRGTSTEAGGQAPHSGWQSSSLGKIDDKGCPCASQLWLRR